METINGLKQDEEQYFSLASENVYVFVTGILRSPWYRNANPISQATRTENIIAMDIQ